MRLILLTSFLVFITEIFNLFVHISLSFSFLSHEYCLELFQYHRRLFEFLKGVFWDIANPCLRAGLSIRTICPATLTKETSKVIHVIIFWGDRRASQGNSNRLNRLIGGSSLKVFRRLLDVRNGIPWIQIGKSDMNICIWN